MAGAGAGVEINSADMKFEYGGAETVLRPYRIAKECGCKFHFGTDAHAPDSFIGKHALLERAAHRAGICKDDLWSLAK